MVQTFCQFLLADACNDQEFLRHAVIRMMYRESADLSSFLDLFDPTQRHALKAQDLDGLYQAFLSPAPQSANRNLQFPSCVPQVTGAPPVIQESVTIISNHSTIYGGQITSTYPTKYRSKVNTKVLRHHTGMHFGHDICSLSYCHTASICTMHVATLTTTNTSVGEGRPHIRGMMAAAANSVLFDDV